MPATKTGKSYQDITEKWINSAVPNSHQVTDLYYFETKNGKRYYVDGKNVVLDYNKEERKIAEWLENTFGGEIYMLPRINKPEGIQTADYLFRKEHWDLKIINGSGKQSIYHAVYKKSNQSCNFILDISNSHQSVRKIMCKVASLYNRKDTAFINQIIIKAKNRFLVIQRKRM